MNHHRITWAEIEQQARIEKRRAAMMDILGAVALAACIAIPTALWWTGVLG